MNFAFVVLCVIVSNTLALICKKRQYSLEKSVGVGVVFGMVFTSICFVMAMLTGYSDVSFFSKNEIGKTLLVMGFVCAAFAVRCGQAANSQH